MTDMTVRWDGLDDLKRSLDALAAPDDTIADAMRDAGGLVKTEALRLVPRKTGRLAGTIQVAQTASTTMQVVAGSAEVPYAYTFHAVALGKSKGGFTFRVPTGRHGKAYVRKARIVNNPFLFRAAETKKGDVYRVFEQAWLQLVRASS